MKKILFTALLVLAIASYGGITTHAHAQSISATDQASLEQALQVAKARLVQLETQQGMIPQGDGGLIAAVTPGSVSAGGTTMTPTGVTLSAQDQAAISAALGSLVTALSNLQAQLAANPDLATANNTAIVSNLRSIGNTLASIVAVMNSERTTPAPVAVNPAPKPVAAAPSPAPVAISTNPTTPATPAPVTPSEPTTPAANQNTAQASSIWGFAKAHWPTITIILLIVLMLVILFWPHEEDEKMGKGSTNRSGNPSNAKPMNSQNQSANVVRSAPQMESRDTHARVPVSTIAPAPAQRIDVQQAKVTVIRPPEPKKTA